MRILLKNIFLCGICIASSLAHAEGGIALGGTRVIYPQGSDQTSLPITNSSSTQRYLVNSWIENAEGKKDKSFIVTPPLYVSEPKNENTLRIMYVGNESTSKDEQLYYLNVKAIPSVDEKVANGKNVLQIAILSRIKMFVRPNNLPMDQHSAVALLAFKKNGAMTTISNPSPYYITLVNVNVDGKRTANFMVSPESQYSIKLSGNNITYQSVNDYGALDKKITSPIN